MTSQSEIVQWKHEGKAYSFDGNTIDSRSGVKASRDSREILLNPGFFYVYRVKLDEDLKNLKTQEASSNFLKNVTNQIDSAFDVIDSEERAKELKRLGASSCWRIFNKKKDESYQAVNHCQYSSLDSVKEYLAEKKYKRYKNLVICKFLVDKLNSRVMLEESLTIKNDQRAIIINKVFQPMEPHLWKH